MVSWVFCVIGNSLHFLLHKKSPVGKPENERIILKRKMFGMQEIM